MPIQDFDAGRWRSSSHCHCRPGDINDKAAIVMIFVFLYVVENDTVQHDSASVAQNSTVGITVC